MSLPPLADLAAEAYLAGYMLHGVPLTERASRGCTAAIAAALDHADDPLVLEVTLHIGQLEGAWALVFDRRERLIARHTAKVEALWRTLTASLDIPGMVAAYRQQAGMTAETERPGWAAALRAEAVAAAAGMLNGVRSSPECDDLVIALEDALAAGAAEGKTAALAVAAEKAGKAGFDWPKAYSHMFEPLNTIEGLPGMGDPWVQQIISGNAGDIGRSMAGIGMDGGTTADMVTAVTDLTQGASIRAIQTLVDYAMSGAMSAGTQALYAAEGVTLLNWVTAGGNVCPQCDTNEAGNPYAPEDFPPMPDHINCVVGSTRVSVPGVVVPGDEPGGFPPRPGGISGATAAAVTEAERDFGRPNIRATSDREYVGDVIAIRTARGYELTVTPNHPVATRGGWVAAAELAVGDHVLCSTRPEWVPGAVDPDVDHIPPRIEDVAQSFPVQSGSVPSAAEDFHGDGAGSEVYVVRADRLLVDDVAPEGSQGVTEDQFGSGYPSVNKALVAASHLVPHFGGVLNPAYGVMGRAGEPRALLGAGLGHAGIHASAAVSARYASPLEVPAYRVSADAVDFCQRLLAGSAEVAADQVVQVRRYPFSGHVYNLDTVGGYYIGNGIITHNCRCVTVSASGDLPLSAFTDFLAAA